MADFVGSAFCRRRAATLSVRADQEECSKRKIQRSAAQLACYFCLTGTMNSSCADEEA